MAQAHSNFLINNPNLWLSCLPVKGREDHKYAHGYARIYGAPVLTGATRLAAESCARMGAGLVTVLATRESAPVYRETLAAHVMVREGLSWSDDRVTANLWGPGGIPVLPDFTTNIPSVLDADALQDLPAKLGPHFVLTPHEGEFERVFPNIGGERLEKAKTAAQMINATIVLKGPETIIASPDGRLVVNNHASPQLATAGTGDVLAGMITGLLAQGMPPFEAACAAVWIHGECALKFGPGLVASDLPPMIPQVLKDLT